MDNANCAVRSSKELEGFLHASIENIARAYGLTLRGETLSTNFEFLVDDLANTAPVVILVDEYDKPILSNITNPEVGEILAVLKGFYSTIKKCEGKLRFAFVTGVTKFCHVSLFSGLNNLTDITMNADYATMLGYTQQEFEENFAEWIAEAETKQELPHDEYLAKVKDWYDGYCFEEGAESVFRKHVKAGVLLFCEFSQFFGSLEKHVKHFFFFHDLFQAEIIGVVGVYFLEKRHDLLCFVILVHMQIISCACAVV